MEEMSNDVPRPKGKIIVGVIFNSKGNGKNQNADDEAEYDNIETVYAIRNALIAGGFEVILFEADETLPQALLETHIDIAFNIAEGRRGRGRESEIPAVLNLLGIPFTGSDETALCVALDKAMCKRLLSSCGISTPGYAVLNSALEAKNISLRFPVIVKPNAEGSSKGIPDACVAADRVQLEKMLESELDKYNEAVLAEEYIDGREFTVGILGNGKNIRVFSPMEIVFRHNTSGDYRVYSYGVKQEYKKHVDYLCPAPISAECENEMKAMALEAFRTLGCNDFARVDFRLSGDDKPYFIEINPLPGLAPGYSDYPMLAEFNGVGYGALVVSVLRAALERLGISEE